MLAGVDYMVFEVCKPLSGLKIYGLETAFRFEKPGPVVANHRLTRQSRLKAY
jgi:hypothetical protein